MCGTFYRYDWTYEYLVNGSEDDETLARLTPTEARQLLSDEEYAERISALRGDLNAVDKRTRRYAARALTDHHLAWGEQEEVEGLLAHPDPEIAAAAQISKARRSRPAP